MYRLSINELTTFRWSFEEDVSHYLAADLPAIGVWRQKLADFGEEKGIELLDDSGLKTSSLMWAGGFTGSEGRSHSESIEDAEDAIRLAAAVRTECLVIYSGARGGHTQNHAKRLTVGALKHLASVAANSSITLAIEPMHPGCAAEWTFLTDLDTTLDLLAKVGSPNLKIVLDTYHLGHDDRVLQDLAHIVGQIAIVHLGDAKRPPNGEQNRCRLGEGILPLKDILFTLSDEGYGGWYEVELMGEDIEIHDYDKLISQSKEAFAELMQAALSR